MKPVSLCVVGCGAVVADLHMPVIEMLERRGAVRVKALVDSHIDRASGYAARFRGARAYARLEDALAGSEIGLTFIASPPGLHAGQALAALAAGSHVLVEKPMVTSSADASRLVASAQAAGRIVAVGLPRRYYPHVAEAAHRLRNRELGDSVRFEYREGGPFDWPIASDAVFVREKSGGGVFMDKGVHALDVLDQLFGPVDVRSCQDDALAGGVESNAVLELAYPGAEGRLQLSWDQPLNNGVWVRGSKAEIFIGLDDVVHYRWRELGGRWRVVEAKKSWPTELGPSPKLRVPRNYYDCISLQWWGALRAVNHGEPPGVDAAGAARVIAAIEAGYACSTPLDLPFLTAPERAGLRSKHWRRAA